MNVVFKETFIFFLKKRKLFETNNKENIFENFILV